MKIHTYYEPNILKDQEWLIDHWKETWSKNGWEPVVLNQNDIDPDELKFYDQTWDSLIQNNPAGYDRACFRRWIAMGRLKDPYVAMSDYDVMNYGETGTWLKHYRISTLTSYQDCCPSFVMGEPKDFFWMASQLRKYAPDSKMEHNGMYFCHDQIVIDINKDVFKKDCVISFQKAVRNLDEQGDYKLIHFAQSSCSNLGFPTKRAAIEDYESHQSTK